MWENEKKMGKRTDFAFLKRVIGLKGMLEEARLLC